MTKVRDVPHFCCCKVLTIKKKNDIILYHIFKEVEFVMKHTFFRLFLFVLCITMLLPFAACGGKKDSETTESTTNEVTTSEKVQTESSEVTTEEQTSDKNSETTEQNTYIESELTTDYITETATETQIETETVTETLTETETDTKIEIVTESETEIKTETMTETETETETETQTDTVTETETKTETETETVNETETVTETLPETEHEETFPETNLILGDDIEYASDFTVSNVFDSDMVIQRNEFVRIWGWAPESENGKKISATFMGYTADALIENGEWEIVFYQRHEANASLGNDLVVYAGVVVSEFSIQSETEVDSEAETDSVTEFDSETESEEEIETNTEADAIIEYVFEDVLIGDVFMVVGQSNVQYSVGQYLASEPNLKWTPDFIGENSIIRYNYNSNTQSIGYPRKGTDEVCKDAINDYGWIIPSEKNVIHLSAFGYLMAHQIAELTDNGIPVGISQFSASGRPLSVFMPNELAEQLGSDHFDPEQGIYIDNHYGHVEARYMYNQYMYPFERMPIAGIVWYQGEAESNIDLSSVYVERFTALMEYMRSTHNIYNKEFPVFYVEFPSVYKVGDSPEYLDTGRIRACTGMIPLSLSNSYIAVGSDLWDNKTNTNNIHPYCKYEQAERVTDLMQAVIYGTKTMDEVAGPTLVSYEISEDHKTIILKFTNCGEGLTTSDGGDIVNGFVPVAKKNKVDTRVNLTVEITAPDTITITASKAIRGVAYNAVASNYFGTDINLCDSDGIPAPAFWIYEED